MKEVGCETLGMKRFHVDAACRRAEMLALRTAFCKIKGPGGDSYGFFGSGSNPRENTKVSSSGPKRNDAVWCRFTNEKVYGVEETLTSRRC